MIDSYRPRREEDFSRFEGLTEQMWYWCPKCHEAVPQLSPKHYAGYCPCQDKTTLEEVLAGKERKYVDMVLLRDSDPRIVKATEWLRS